MGHSLDVGAHQRAVYPDTDAVIELLDVHADLPHFTGDRFQMLGDNIGDQHVATGRSGGDHKGAGLDLVGDDGVNSAVKLLYAANLDDIGAGAHDVSAHGVQEVCQIYNVRFLGGVFDHRQPSGTNRSQHGVHGCANGYHI